MRMIESNRLMEESLRHQEMEKDSMADEEEHLPSSEHLATTLGMSAHRMQVMKASFFATDPEPEEYDYGMSTIPPPRPSMFDIPARPSPIPKMEESMTDRG